jgi:hypothetical protein
MNDYKIRLPGFLIADLFKNSLVIMDDEASTEKKIPKKEKQSIGREWFLGSNLQKITILVSEKEAVYLYEDSLQFLSSILGACKLNLGDVAIVNHHTNAVDYTLLKEKLSPAVLLLFGVTAQQVKLPFTIPDYQVQKYDNCQILLSPPLTSMLGNTQEAKLEKSKLWLCLKKMFNV